MRPNYLARVRSSASPSGIDTRSASGSWETPELCFRLRGSDLIIESCWASTSCLLLQFLWWSSCEKNVLKDNYNFLPNLEIFGSLALLPCSAICLIMWLGGEIVSFCPILSVGSLLNFRGEFPPTDSPKVNCWGMYSWSRQEAINSSGVLRNCSFLYFKQALCSVAPLPVTIRCVELDQGRDSCKRLHLAKILNEWILKSFPDSIYINSTNISYV